MAIQIYLKRGSALTHAGCKLRRGTLTLVTDLPELRYHDGTTEGGISIPVSTEIHKDIIAVYLEAGMISGI